jgi:hypothetical protein
MYEKPLPYRRSGLGQHRPVSRFSKKKGKPAARFRLETLVGTVVAKREPKQEG